MRVEPFALERWQSLHEHHVEVNLSDSGVHPVTVSDVLPAAADRARLLERLLEYTQTNGTTALRESIAALYPGATVDNVLATSGGAEANFLAVWNLVEPGDEVVMMRPTYMHVWGVAEGLGATCRAWTMHPRFDEGRWDCAVDQLESLTNARTKLIVLCNPNNPTGEVFNARWLDAVASVAARHGTWILADEIYAGSELDEGAETTPSMWGRHERLVITNSLSKAYGLPGLRLGWLVGAPEHIATLWSHHDYTTICPAALSDDLGAAALQPVTRARLLARTKSHLRDTWFVARQWLERRGDLRYVAPRAGAMLWLKYPHAIASSDLAERLLREHSVLVVPGDQYGHDGWLRIGFGGEAHVVREGLERLGTLLDSLGRD